MIKSYFISVLRSLWKNKLSTFVIIISIGISIAASLLLYKYSNYQLSFDKFNKKADRIYRVPYKRIVDGSIETNSAANVSALAPWMKEHFPEIEEIVRIFHTDNSFIFKYIDKKGNRNTIENHLNWVDTNFCELFPVEFIYGNSENAFKRRFTINISQSLSEKMFGKENPLGKTIQMSPGEDKPYEIVGVYKDFPPNSELNFDILMSFKQVQNLFLANTWLFQGTHTFLLLKENASLKVFQEKLDKSLNGELGRLFTESLTGNFQDAKDYNDLIKKHHFQYELTLQPLTQLNFSFKEKEFKIHKEKRMIVFLFIISIFILLIAWINYFNLAVVKMLENITNTQIRKVIGANNKQLFILFLIESIIINIIGFFLALVIYRSVFPYFINLSELPFSLSPFSLFIYGSSSLYAFCLVVIILFLISLLVPLILPFVKYFIQNKYFNNESTIPYRNTRNGVQSFMVIIQFTFSIFMIASVVTIYNQMKYMNKKELGFNPDQIFVIKAPTFIDNTYFKNFKPFCEEIERNPKIIEFSEATSVPPIQMLECGIKSNYNSDKQLFSYIFHNKDYFNFFNIKFIAGSNYTRGSEFKDSVNRKVIINETACKKLNFKSPEDAIGQSLLILNTNFFDLGFMDFAGGKAEIIGVCKDYFHNSVRQEKKPTMFFQIPEAIFLPYYCFKFRAESASEAHTFICDTWKEYFPDFPLTNYFFLDQKFEQQYDADTRFGIISGIFSFLSVLLACTGLFMLSSYNILKRTKEVGIRKSNGATSFQIINLFINKFLYMIIIAYIIAIPLSYFIMNKWLMNYPYRITLGVWFFLIPLLIIVIITIGTVLSQVLIAARSNPVETLRYE